jgi:hypothetical protein
MKRVEFLAHVMRIGRRTLCKTRPFQFIIHS